MSVKCSKDYFIKKKIDIHEGIYIEYIPSLKLRPYIKRMYFVEDFHAYANIDIHSVSKENIELQIHYGETGHDVFDTNHNDFVNTRAYFFGIQQMNRLWLSRMKNSMAMFSIEFTLLGISYLLNTCCAELFNKVVCIQDILGSSSVALVDRVRNERCYNDKIRCIENYFTKILCKSYKPDKQERFIQVGLKALEHYSIQQICEKLQVSTRSLERCFKKRMGISPKEYLKIMRFNKACELLCNYPQIDYSEIIHNCKYYDQSHFIKEFRALAGMSPIKYLQKTNGLFYLGRGYII